MAMTERLIPLWRSSRALHLLLFLLLLLSRLGPVDSYSSGAPESQCSYLTPKHGFQPQQGKPYAKVRLGQKRICRGQQVSNV